MPSLILSSETLHVNRHSERLEVVRRVEGDRRETMQVPLFDIDRVVVIGQPSVSMPALTSLIDRGIPCFFVTRYGRWRGTLTPDNNQPAH